MSSGVPVQRDPSQTSLNMFKGGRGPVQGRAEVLYRGGRGQIPVQRNAGAAVLYGGTPCGQND